MARWSPITDHVLGYNPESILASCNETRTQVVLESTRIIDFDQINEVIEITTIV
jgi:hypothetical protein